MFISMTKELPGTKMAEYNEMSKSNIKLMNMKASMQLLKKR